MKYVFVIILLLISLNVFAEKKPLFELGVAGFVAHIPDYPAADQGRGRYLVVPTFLYRGFIFRSDKKGTRARFFKSDKWDIDLSLSASLPSSSDNNETRKGMADLDTLLELGPRVNYELFDNDIHALNLEFPLRHVISTDIQHTQEHGTRFTPEIDYKYKITPKYKLSLSMKLNYASEKLHDYFYQVDTPDSTNKRASYNATPGYLSRDISFNIIHYRKHMSIILGFRHSDYSGAQNEKSPLFKSNEDSTIFLGFNYFWYQSERFE
jgi:outer membrane scaffolding protein for murein synthesis (MipA/OmpV family)